MAARIGSQYLTVTIDHHVARVLLNRPPVNALNRELVADLSRLAASLKKFNDVWLVSVTSALPTFCAGADLKERSAFPPTRVASTVRAIQRMVLAWAELPQPVIMGINGAALGGGLEFALAADVLVASDAASLGFPEVSLGIIPAAGGTQLLPMRTSLAVARKWILSGQRFTAHQAMTDGVVDHMISGELFSEEYEAILLRISANAPLALRQAKKALISNRRTSLHTGLRRESAAYAPLIKTADRVEALRAFSEKRQPVWRGN